MRLARLVMPGDRGSPLSHASGAIPGALALAAIVLYGASSGVRSEVVILIYVYALLGAGLYVPLVLTDQVSLAYGAYFGVGAYTFAIISARGLFDPLFAIPLAMLIAAAAAGFIAIAMKRLSGYFLAVATMLLAIVFSRVLLEASDVTGGPTGLTFDSTLLGVRITRQELLIGAAVVVWLVMMAVNNLRASRLGNALRLMSHSLPAAESIGLDTRWARVSSLCVGAAIASLAGSVFALSQGFVLPESFGLEIAFLILFMPIIGGVDSPWGCLIGGTLVALVLLFAPSFGPSRLLFGLVVLGFVLVFPGGILAAIATATERLRGVGRAAYRTRETHAELPVSVIAGDVSVSSHPQSNQPTAPVHRELLRVDKLVKHFGGIQALRYVSFTLHEGEVLGIVGPNGAGKSTLVDIVTGVQPADLGTVLLDGREIRASVATRARLGMARTFQHPLLAGALTIRDNVELGLLRGADAPASLAVFGWFLSSMTRGRRRDAAPEASRSEPPRESAVKAAYALLSRDWLARASDVSYAVEKIAEVARALISVPRVLIMDEPFAGLDRESVHTVWNVLQESRSRQLAIIVVDHNVDLLREICDRIIVMDQGSVIAEGHPSEVLQRAEVRKAYFGERDA